MTVIISLITITPFAFSRLESPAPQGFSQTIECSQVMSTETVSPTFLVQGTMTVAMLDGALSIPVEPTVLTM